MYKKSNMKSSMLKGKMPTHKNNDDKEPQKVPETNVKAKGVFDKRKDAKKYSKETGETGYFQKSKKSGKSKSIAYNDGKMSRKVKIKPKFRLMTMLDPSLQDVRAFKKVTVEKKEDGSRERKTDSFIRRKK